MAVFRGAIKGEVVDGERHHWQDIKLRYLLHGGSSGVSYDELQRIQDRLQDGIVAELPRNTPIQGLQYEPIQHKPSVSKCFQGVMFSMRRIADLAPQALECGVPPDVVLRLGSSGLISAALKTDMRSYDDAGKKSGGWALEGARFPMTGWKNGARTLFHQQSIG